MLVRLVTRFRWGGERRRPGEALYLPVPVGLRLIERGQATPVLGPFGAETR